MPRLYPMTERSGDTTYWINPEMVVHATATRAGSGPNPDLVTSLGICLAGVATGKYFTSTNRDEIDDLLQVLSGKAYDTTGGRNIAGASVRD